MQDDETNSTNDRQQDDNATLPSNAAIQEMTYQRLAHTIATATNAARQILLNASRIDYPNKAQQQSILTNAVDLIATIADALDALVHHHNRRFRDN